MSSFAPGTDPRVMAEFEQRFYGARVPGMVQGAESQVTPQLAVRDAGRVGDFNRMASGIPGFPSFNAARPLGGQTLGSMPSGNAGLSSDAMTPEGQQMPYQQQQSFNPYQQQQQQQPQFNPYQQFQQFQQQQFNPYQQQFQQQFNPMMGGGFNPMMGGYGGGFNPMMGGFNPMMGGYGGGFNPMMGGYGGGFNPMMGGYGGGFNPMMGGYGGGFNPMMGGIGGFFGGQSGMQFGQQGPANAGPRARTPDLSMFGGQSTNPSRNFSNPAPQPGLGSQPNPGPQQPAQSQGSGGGGLF